MGTNTVLRRVWAFAVLGAVVAVGAVQSAAQRPAGSDKANVVVDPALLAGLEYRSLGFSRGGRVTAVAGVRGQPLVYYFGSTGGGVFKTTDGGLTWVPVSDGFFQAGSIGAIAVAESDPNVVYVGTGSACPRGNISIGVGVYKSTDAGRTWQHLGLPNAGLIGRIRVHPTNPDLVYVAVLGNIFGPNDERGVYRSKDGGRTWERVLFVSNRTGAVDLAMDPTNPRILYAAMWTVERKPWTIHSGSLEGGLFKTTDGGDHWERLGGGLPTDVMVGKIGVAVSPAKPDRVWALVEAAGDRGGVYRSDDGGKTWQRVNSQRMLLQRAWYYIHIYADPKHPDTVYALNTGFYKSTDGGRTWQTIRVPHGDNHDLWINPDDPQIMINSNDGGANVSFNGGQSWTHQMNQPTAEFYRVTVDTRFPYRVYGAQQDNSTASVPSRPLGGFGAGGGFGVVDFYAVGGGESGHIAVDPRNPDIVYAGSYGGVITKFNEETRTLESIEVYPEARTGQRAADQKYRFQWNAPIRLSPHNPDVIYMTSQYVHRTQDGGFTWDVISPDLTRNDKAKQDYSGGTGITRDNTGVEVYDVIFAFEESPHKPGLLWAGSDDGLVHISHDNGKTWQNITPKEMPEWGCVNMIDLSAHDPGRAHIAVYKYRQNDFSPYIFQTNDYGKTWRRLTNGKNGIPPNHFVRVVREDPHRKGLLYAGTEFGMYVSFDDGAHWQSLQLNLPVTPITDLYVHPVYKDLVVATQGRAFWILDDLGVLHQLNERVETTRNHLFKPEDGYRTGMGPINLYYYLAEGPKQPIRIEILDGKNEVVASYTSRRPESEAERPGGEEEFFGPARPPQVTARKGLNRFAWNARHGPLFQIPRGIVMWGGGGAGAVGPKVVPGRYQVRLTVGDWRATEAFEVKPDPRFKTTRADYEEQLKLAREVGAKIAELYRDLATIREIKRQATELGERLRRGGYGEDAAKAARALADRLTAVEGDLTQLQGEGGQDALNFPGRLDNQFVRLYNEIVNDDKRPSKGEYQRFEDLKPELAKLQGQLDQILKTDLAKFNELVRSKNVPPIIVARPGTTTSEP